MIKEEKRKPAIRIKERNRLISIVLLLILLSSSVSSAYAIIPIDPTGVALTAAVFAIMHATMILAKDVTIIEAAWPFLTDKMKQMVIKRLIDHDKGLKLKLPQDFSYKKNGKEYLIKKGAKLEFIKGKMYITGTIKHGDTTIQDAEKATISNKKISFQYAKGIITKSLGYISWPGKTELYFKGGLLKKIALKSNKGKKEVKISDKLSLIFDKGDEINISISDDKKINISLSSDSAVVDDYKLIVSCINISPGSKYRYKGSKYDNFALYVKKNANEFMLCLRTSEKEKFPSGENKGVIDFLTLSAELNGRFEYEKKNSLGLFTNIIETKESNKISMKLDVAAKKIEGINTTRSELHVFSGPFDIYIKNSTENYRFYDYLKPYSVLMLNANITILNKTLERSADENTFRMYIEDSLNGKKFFEELKSYSKGEAGLS